MEKKGRRPKNKREVTLEKAQISIIEEKTEQLHRGDGDDEEMI